MYEHRGRHNAQQPLLPYMYGRMRVVPEGGASGGRAASFTDERRGSCVCHHPSSPIARGDERDLALPYRGRVFVCLVGPSAGRGPHNTVHWQHGAGPSMPLGVPRWRGRGDGEPTRRLMGGLRACCLWSGGTSALFLSHRVTEDPTPNGRHNPFVALYPSTFLFSLGFRSISVLQLACTLLEGPMRPQTGTITRSSPKCGVVAPRLYSWLVLGIGDRIAGFTLPAG